MTATSGGDAPHTVDADIVDRLRAEMLACEPNWPVMAGELARHIEILLPLVAGTLQAVAAQQALYEHHREVDEWHRTADRYYAAFDATITR